MPPSSNPLSLKTDRCNKLNITTGSNSKEPEKEKSIRTIKASSATAYQTVEDGQEKKEEEKRLYKSINRPRARARTPIRGCFFLGKFSAPKAVICIAPEINIKRPPKIPSISPQRDRWPSVRGNKSDLVLFWNPLGTTVLRAIACLLEGGALGHAAEEHTKVGKVEKL